jgi:hypothetical protein
VASAGQVKPPPEIERLRRYEKAAECVRLPGRGLWLRKAASACSSMTKAHSASAQNLCSSSSSSRFRQIQDIPHIAAKKIANAVHVEKRTPRALPLAQYGKGLPP